MSDGPTNAGGGMTEAQLAEYESALSLVPYHRDGTRLYLDDADVTVIDGVREMGLRLLAEVRRLRVALADAEARAARAEGERDQVRQAVGAYVSHMIEAARAPESEKEKYRDAGVAVFGRMMEVAWPEMPRPATVKGGSHGQ